MGSDSRKAERYRDFFDLQLRFAAAIAGKASIPIAEAALRYTNLHRRFGLGDVTGDAGHGLRDVGQDAIAESLDLGAGPVEVGLLDRHAVEQQLALGRTER